jgi:Uri superfamily endonuclease
VESVIVGKLGTLAIQTGYWVYVGSAFGPGGLNARVSRHLKTAKIKHWHIDYLRAAAQIDAVWYTLGLPSVEHAWAGAFLALPGAQVPLKRFGASDCDCPAHLIFYDTAPSYEDFSSVVKDPGCAVHSKEFAGL